MARAHPTFRSRHALVAVSLALATGACEGRRTITGESALSRLTVRVRAAPAAAAAAQTLGWPEDAVPGAVVVVTRISRGDGTALTDTATTDASGLVRFPGLAAVEYAIAITRSLTAAEEAAAGDALGSTLAFTGAGTADLGASGDDSLDIEVRAVGGGSLVFSEIYPTVLFDGISNLYWYDNYWEIYNNADTTVALAGKLWFRAWPGYIQGPNYSCSDYTSLENDPKGLWALWVYRFPATAAPLGPGESTVIATDALDHTQLVHLPGAFDLSHAQFEFPGASDADNPLAQNMLDVGLYPYNGGHGYHRSPSNRSLWGLATALDLDTLPSQVSVTEEASPTFVRIPTAALLDVVYFHAKDYYIAAYPDCPRAVLPDVDAGMVELIGMHDTLAIHRKVAKTLSNGRVILQVSHNSAADFVAGPGTPGRVP